MQEKFKKYPSIENSYRKKFIDQIREQALDGGMWHVQEKIHGSNFSVWFKKNRTVLFAKRSDFLEESDNFFNWQQIAERYKSSFEYLKNLLNNIPATGDVVVFGEIFGGVYHHPDVEKCNDSQIVQKGVEYTPWNEFMAFDIAVYNDEKYEFEFLPLLDAQAYCKEAGIPFVPILFTGTFDECLDCPNEFLTMIPDYFGLPDIENNICEGVVIKPERNKYLWTGNRAVVKNKNQKHSEKTSGAGKQPKEENVSRECEHFLNEVENYITENRLRNVLSKIGEVTDKDFGRIMGEYTKDVMKDFTKENDISALEKAERKKINKHVGQVAANVLRRNFLNIIDGEF